MNFALLSCLFVTGCKKPEVPVEDPPLVVAVNQTDGLDFTCGSLPEDPLPVGWKDTANLPDKNINAFFYNPLNPNQMIYIVNGDLFGYNKMFLYTIPTKQSTYLGDNGDFLPRANKNGWIVFNRADLNIYKVKITGDSLTRLTTSSMNSDPRWDYQGNTIYYFQAASASSPSRLVQMTRNGTIITTFPTELPNTAVAHIPGRLAYLKTTGSIVSVFLRDIATSSETLIVSAPKNSSSFSHLTFDSTDEYLYWSTSDGVFRSSVASPAIEKLVGNCPNSSYSRPYADSKGKVTFGCHVKKPLTSPRLLHQYKAIEMELGSRQLHEVKVFP